MKVTGPSSGQPGAPSGVGSSDDVKKPESGSGKAFAERMAPTTPATTNATTNATTTTARDAAVSGAQRALDTTVAQLAADLKAGRLQPREAVEKVVDQMVSTQLGAEAPAGVREKLRAALLDTLQNDPLLAEKLAELGG